MNDRRAQLDLRINVLPAQEVGVWHSILELALELDKPDALLRSVRLGCFDYVAADDRTGYFSPALMAQIFERPLALVESTIEKLLELGILTRDGQTLSIEDAPEWFIPFADHPRQRN